MTLGFMTLVVAKYVYLLNSTKNFHVMFFIPHVNIEVGFSSNLVDNGYIFWYFFVKKSAVNCIWLIIDMKKKLIQFEKKYFNLLMSLQE